jgi:hypothetical protein
MSARAAEHVPVGSVTARDNAQRARIAELEHQLAERDATIRALEGALRDFAGPSIRAIALLEKL